MNPSKRPPRLRLPGASWLFFAGFWLASGAALGYPAGANLYALLTDLVAWLS